MEKAIELLELSISEFEVNDAINVCYSNGIDV